MVTDGAAVMEKTGRWSEVLHQICRSHGIHLAVVDVLHKKNNTGEHEEESFDCDTTHEARENEEWILMTMLKQQGKNQYMTMKIEILN